MTTFVIFDKLRGAKPLWEFSWSMLLFQEKLACESHAMLVLNCTLFLCSQDVGNWRSMQRSQYRGERSSSWLTNYQGPDLKNDQSKWWRHSRTLTLLPSLKLTDEGTWIYMARTITSLWGGIIIPSSAHSFICTYMQFVSIHVHIITIHKRNWKLSTIAQVDMISVHGAF